VAFHRVLQPEDPRWATALVPWTMTDDIFRQCLIFFRNHYSLVTLGEVMASLEGKRPLPSRSLLITFDDGFADNFDYALPLLRQHDASAAVFITSDVVGHEERLWTEELLWAVMAGRVSQAMLAQLYVLLFAGSAYDPEDPMLIWKIVHQRPQVEPVQVDADLAKLKIELVRVTHPRQMLTRDEIAGLIANGLFIGAHGKTHAALPSSSDLLSELCQARATLTEIVAAHGHPPVDALSFPHGVYTSDVVHQALAAGYRLLFTGDAAVCMLKHGFLTSPVVGRIDVPEARVSRKGTFRPAVLATLLFTAARQHARPARFGLPVENAAAPPAAAAPPSRIH
jgi:peptidoglycan/xylan/chitin deacetylase (PgdA/CDA1 family)